MGSIHILSWYMLTQGQILQGAIRSMHFKGPGMPFQLNGMPWIEWMFRILFHSPRKGMADHFNPWMAQEASLTVSRLLA